MADAPTTATTQVPPHEGGFPPFDTTTYPSQLFWLAVTFAFLFVVLWKVAGPRLHGAIAARRGAINGAIAAANRARADADAASADYDRALAAARSRSQALAEETRQRINAEIAAEKAKAEAQAAAATADADARIAATRTAAQGHIMGSARDAAIAIVARLTGETVSADEADAAVRNGAVGG
jgi:F-type H+-transporting ATPase subunit b